MSQSWDEPTYQWSPAGKASPNQTNVLGTFRAHSLTNWENTKAKKQKPNKLAKLGRCNSSKHYSLTDCQRKLAEDAIASKNNYLPNLSYLCPQDMASKQQMPCFFLYFVLVNLNVVYFHVCAFWILNLWRFLFRWIIIIGPNVTFKQLCSCAVLCWMWSSNMKDVMSSSQKRFIVKTYRSWIY